MHSTRAILRQELFTWSYDHRCRQSYVPPHSAHASFNALATQANQHIQWTQANNKSSWSCKKIIYEHGKICECSPVSLFLAWDIFSHHTDQMSQRSQVSGIALWRCSLNVFVFVIVFVFVFVFVIVVLLVRSCPLITLNKCLKGHKSLGSLFEGVL